MPFNKAETALEEYSQDKKDGILKNLVPLMPASRHTFWLGLNTDNASAYLIFDNETDKPITII